LSGFGDNLKVQIDSVSGAISETAKQALGLEEVVSVLKSVQSGFENAKAVTEAYTTSLIKQNIAQDAGNVSKKLGSTLIAGMGGAIGLTTAALEVLAVVGSKVYRALERGLFKGIIKKILSLSVHVLKSDFKFQVS
jgi:hypothetical protein